MHNTQMSFQIFMNGIIQITTIIDFVLFVSISLMVRNTVDQSLVDIYAFWEDYHDITLIHRHYRQIWVVASGGIQDTRRKTDKQIISIRWLR